VYAGGVATAGGVAVVFAEVTMGFVPVFVVTGACLLLLCLEVPCVVAGVGVVFVVGTGFLI
jgi:hypothetical protein